MSPRVRFICRGRGILGLERRGLGSAPIVLSPGDGEARPFSSKGGRAHASEVFEDAAEMVAVAEPGGDGDLFDGIVGVVKPEAGFLHPPFHQKRAGRSTGVMFEPTDQRVRMHADLVRQFFIGPGVGGIVCDRLDHSS